MASYEYKDGELNRIAGGVLYADLPIGSIIYYGGTVAPSGWFICDYSALNRVTYAELFAVIGTTYGSGDGSTTFNIPNKPATIGCYIIKAQQIGVPADFAPVDTVAANNMNSVTSGAVYSKINELLHQDHYNANTDRTNIENRKQAILHVIKNFPSSMFTIRYLDGYYIFYIANPFFTAERTVLEINNYDSEINIYQINPLNTTISLVRSI